MQRLLKLLKITETDPGRGRDVCAGVCELCVHVFYGKELRGEEEQGCTMSDDLRCGAVPEGLCANVAVWEVCGGGVHWRRAFALPVLQPIEELRNAVSAVDGGERELPDGFVSDLQEMHLHGA
ncbi:uncharacterized protein MONOS_7544 [Monocercomonoides exilis]|uniref:uncharacterized protein n=1 Tax=Monocercomonoides exilis TaxID=2049356 RepID=UPI00355A4D92|nr:hypothetical protein MONOS_7544 [Monocercomonoides exilis]|eukprot:MONOS_7544.1-p1 / transcript=MONOS_7544.1 / gene=MONOS_7544 / organism=Monocercomonoides_exilis_PA203 / gene_product=unspecified product / transcript_product=unspecified product / location=Mono_scaffold00260:22602-23030(+) / protein_length=123 / sequence_SO=supercontig / SO=protein_coding / is_pseudo=false